MVSSKKETCHSQPKMAELHTPGRPQIKSPSGAMAWRMGKRGNGFGGSLRNTSFPKKGVEASAWESIPWRSPCRTRRTRPCVVAASKTSALMHWLPAESSTCPKMSRTYQLPRNVPAELSKLCWIGSEQGLKQLFLRALGSQHNISKTCVALGTWLMSKLSSSRLRKASSGAEGRHCAPINPRLPHSFTWVSRGCK